MPEARTRAPRADQVLSQAVDLARESAQALAHPRTVGSHLGFTMDAERLGTHWFAATDAGYVGWAWAVTVARVPRSRTATVCEIDMIPRDGALLAPEWIPWEDRLRPGDLSREDALPYQAEDSRLEQSFEDVGDDPDLAEFMEIGLGRKRVLSDEGRQAAIDRWYQSDQGPKPGRAPKNACSTCGFLVKMAGAMRTVFGVCANEWAPDDGRVVSLDHTCGAHSETDVPKQGSQWPVRPSRVDDGAIDSEPMPDVAADETAAEPVEAPKRRRRAPSAKTFAERASAAGSAEPNVLLEPEEATPADSVETAPESANAPALVDGPAPEPTRAAEGPGALEAFEQQSSAAPE